MGGHKQIVSVPEFNGEFCPFNIISNKLECFIVIHTIFSIVVIISTSICIITKISHSMARFRHDFVSSEGLRLWVPCKAHVSTPHEFWLVSTVWAILYASRERTAMTLIHVRAYCKCALLGRLWDLRGCPWRFFQVFNAEHHFEKAFSTKDPGSSKSVSYTHLTLPTNREV